MLEKLKQLDLTSGEARVFLSLLKLGQSKVGAIVKDSRVSYSKVYDVLERLMKKGLVSYVLIENVKQFRAAEPHRINEYIENKEKEINKQKELASELIPQLMKITKTDDRTKVEVFIGKKGLKTAYEILMQGDKKQVLRYFYPFDKYHSVSDEFFMQLSPKMKLKVKEKGISTIKYKSSGAAKKLPKECSMRFVDFPLPGTIDVLGNKVLIVTWSGEITGILITSKEIANHYTNYFDSLWKIAKK